MRTIRYDDPLEMLRWAEARIPGMVFRRDAKAIGLCRNGTLIAVAVLDTFSATDCQVHVAADRSRPWLTRKFAQHVAIYAFVTAKRRRIQCIVSADNAAAIRFAERMGWRLEGRFREAGAMGEDELSFGLLRRECRWLPPLGLGALAKPR